MRRIGTLSVLAAFMLITSLIVSSCAAAEETTISPESASSVSSTAAVTGVTGDEDSTATEVSGNEDSAATEATRTTEEITTATTKWEISTHEFVHYGIPYLAGAGSAYLICDERVSVVDESAADGIDPVKDGERITLPAGTIVLFFDEKQDPVRELAQDICYMVLIDGRCIAFSTTTGEDGKIRLNGKPTTEVFSGDPYQDPPVWPRDEEYVPHETEIIEDVDLAADEGLDCQYKEYRNINIYVGECANISDRMVRE